VNEVKGTYMKRILKWMNAILGIVFFIWLAYRLKDDQEDAIKMQYFLTRFSSDYVFWLLGALLLVPVNISIDAYKWRLALQSRYRLGQSFAFRAILVGLSVGILTPNRIGEFAGRLLFVTSKYRIAATTATLISSLSALVVVYFLGGIAILWYEWPATFPDWLRQAGVLIVLVAFGMLISIYFGSNKLLTLIRKLPRGRRFTKYLRFSAHFSKVTLFRLLVLSLIRALIVYIQLFCLARFVGLFLTFDTLIFIFPVLFLFQAIIPSSIFTDLGVRGSLAYILFFPFCGSVLLSIMPSYLLWLTNVIIPASLGGLLLINSRRNGFLGNK
jgi:uncharacterized membrane protein YbhN (UPF0104 family)